ncbi:MAG: exoribonuclease II [Chlamydiae bacterium CG10_big_fil_rev_8_21_14_0_10_42_34]|nr:MAG: exoribonuclease II [Chlamydiae bacterium CG10_big_fil_rev_8_21_14_0_10_42_34]
MTERLTLEKIAHQAMLEKGFVPDFPPPLLHELESIKAPAPPHEPIRDMRRLLWVSIDNDDSKDLDQLTYAEHDRIYIAVADVDAIVKKGSVIDHRAAHNTTSVYTPTKVFPMLPPKLSTNLTSLNPDTDRCAIVVEVKVDQSGHFELSDIYHALVHNHAQLSYTCVGALLEHTICKNPMPKILGLKEQLILQDRFAQKIQEYRNKQGALEFGVIQLHPVIIDGIAVDLEEIGRNRAHKLIENFMIAANVASTRYLKDRGLPTLKRVVKTPKRWDRIVALANSLGGDLPSQPDPKALRHFLLEQQQSAPLQFPDLSLAMIKLLGRGEYVLGIPGKKSPGHFDLAERDYTHATAPNRRFPDLIMQRLLKSSLFDLKPAYTQKELAALAAHCTQKEDDATKVERLLLKCAAAMVLRKDVGKVFTAMVTGASPKGTWVRLEDPPIEGKLTKGFKGLDVGDYLKVKLIHVDVHNGHIDFANES